MRIIISGGGTGGHIFPAIAIANKIRERYNNASILFVGAKGKMEMEKVPEAGYEIEGLWISGIQRKITIDNLIFPVKLVFSLMKSSSIIRKFKPDVVVGVGGFASGPLLYRASGAGVPTLIQEQNSYPGITNKILAKRVNKICVAYDGMNKFFPADKIIKTGNPVRRDILNINTDKTEAADHFGLRPDKKTILVVGGSQGSLTLNTSIAGGILDICEAGYQLIWQTGTFYSGTAQQLVQQHKEVWTGPFIKRMDLAYGMADVVVTRAGASTISELCLVAKPCILVPYPHAAEDHQTKNAMSLVEREAGVIIADSKAANELMPALMSLLHDDKRMKKISENLKKMAIADSSDRIVNEIIALSANKV